MSERTRRWLLASLATGATAGLAGCQFGTSDGSGTDSPAPQSPGETPVKSPDETPVDSPSPVPDDEDSTPGQTVDGTTPRDRSSPTPTIPGTGDLSDLERRVVRAASSLQSSMAALREDGQVVGSAWNVQPKVLATANHRAFENMSVETVGGEPLSTTTLDGGGSESSAISALRTESARPTLSIGDPDTLSTGDVVVTLSYYEQYYEWIPTYGRVRSWTGDRVRFVSTIPNASLGAPTVTLEGDVVGMAVGYESDTRTATAGPPEPAPPTVETSINSWFRPSHEPVTDVVEAVESLTE